MVVDEILKKLNSIKTRALRSVKMARSVEALEKARIRYVGKKGQLTGIMRQVGGLDADAKPLAGQTANSVKAAIQQAIQEKEDEIKTADQENQIRQEKIDITLPGSDWQVGRKHPITLVTEEIVRIFTSMGFGIARGPDIESDHNNFEMLNMPKHHPARDMHDTFYIDKEVVLRTHTSPVQIRTMQKHPPPIAIISPGRVYRCDSDSTHSPMFHQIEGLLVDERIRFSDLKGVLGSFLRRMMGPDVKTRFRPSYFPFTEPSAEVDILWKVEGSRPKWLEVLGAGMVHPKVLEAGGYDPSRTTGFAFGMGPERIAMLKYGIDDIRHFYANDLRFLRQF